ncbi:MAG: hypothetical protein AAFX03_00095 [Pseudomonadota bacterium]
MRALASLACLAVAACAHAAPPGDPASIPGAMPAAAELSAEEIVARAHAAAGGAAWVRPETLRMSGYGIFYRGGAASVHDRHEMWRVYPTEKGDAHAADGKVRIDSFKDGAPVFQVAFDGATTYTEDGPVAEAADSSRWQANFGFGVIRFALDDGYAVRREGDDLVDGRAAHIVVVTDPAGGETLFAIAADDYAILKVGFDTPRGWHERIYSDFYSKEDVDWAQPGRVRLFYNGVKANEVIWTDFEVDAPIADEIFVLGGDAPEPVEAFAAPDPFAEIQVYERAAHDRTETECDRLAGHPSDPEKVGDGVERPDMDLEAAIAACVAAVEADPGNPRLNYQAARAHGYAGRHAEGDPYRVAALNAGYPQSLFVVGYIRLIGWDGRPADPCYGGELIRRSAAAGRLAGLVGFPHYASAGMFEGCGAYPAVDAGEMAGFLDRADEMTDDFYQQLLIEQLRKAL